MRIFEVYAYLPEVKDCEKNEHRHMCDIGVYAYLRALFFEHDAEMR